MKSETDTSLEGIAYPDSLPLEWTQISELPSGGELNRINRDNEVLLQTLLTLAEPLSEHEEESADAGSENLRRVEVKLNLMLDLLGEIILSGSPLPQARAVQIGTTGLRVHDVTGNGLSKDSFLEIKLYLDPRFPRFLVLQGRVKDIYIDGFSMKYQPFEERFQDLLDKYVFRQHRRIVAMGRHQ